MTGDRDYSKMTWYEAHHMVYRAHLYLTNNDSISGGFSQAARELLCETMFTIKPEVAA